MDPLALRAYALLLSLLLAKYVAVTTVQARARFASRTFRWPEDAAAWAGRAAERVEADAIERAQAVLRNDAETQPLVLATAACWLALGASGRDAMIVLSSYGVARLVHAYFLLRPRQPARNRAFVLGQLLFLGMTLDVLRRAFGG